MRRRTNTLVPLGIAGISLFLLTGAVLAQASKTSVSGYMDNAQLTAYGTVWWADGTLHLRDRYVQWDTHFSDPRIDGVLIDKINQNYFGGKNAKRESVIWGEVWIELADGRFWKGSWQGEVVGGQQKGDGVLHGHGGDIEGLLLKLTFTQRLGAIPTVFDVSGYILDPKG